MANEQPERPRRRLPIIGELTPVVVIWLIAEAVLALIVLIAGIQHNGDLALPLFEWLVITTPAGFLLTRLGGLRRFREWRRRHAAARGRFDLVLGGLLLVCGILAKNWVESHKPSVDTYLSGGSTLSQGNYDSLKTVSILLIVGGVLGLIEGGVLLLRASSAAPPGSQVPGPQDGQVFCRDCGTGMPPGSGFCPNCGTPQPS